MFFRFSAFGLVWACLFLATLEACQVPVFRYALERWKNDPYQIYVVSDGELSGDAKGTYEFLRSLEVHEESPANIYVEPVDLATDRDAGVFRKHLEELDLALPAIFMYYPDDRMTFPPIWAGAANMQNAQAVVDSKIRREIMGRILDGDSAVWVMVESGNRELDDSAFDKMGSFLKKAGADLEIPEGVIEAAQAREALASGQFIDQSNILESEIELKIKFSRLRLSRKAAGEGPFLKMLLTMEEDLGDFAGEPMFFPVFGKGRALEPLIGEGIDLENVLDYSQYITGACSCEVKKQNPGIDLLTRLDWHAALEDGPEFVLEKLLPPLEGVAMVMGQKEKASIADISFAQGAVSATSGTSVSGGDKEAGEGQMNYWVLVLGGFVVVLLLGSLFSMRK